MSTTLEEIKGLFRQVAEAQREAAVAQREVAAAQKETDRQFQETKKETDRQFQETKQFLREQSQETDRRFQETEQFLKDLLKRQSEEADRRFRETDRRFRETDRQIKAIGRKMGYLDNRLGEFVEGLVQPAVVRLFQERGIAVHEVHNDVESNRGDEGTQIDLLVVNDTEAVLVEVKSKLSVADVNDHLERLEKFKRLLPRYADVQAMGAIAAMVIPKDAARYAERKGLFVLGQCGDSIAILNSSQFQPKAW